MYLEKLKIALSEAKKKPKGKCGWKTTEFNKANPESINLKKFFDPKCYDKGQKGTFDG